MSELDEQILNFRIRGRNLRGYNLLLPGKLSSGALKFISTPDMGTDHVGPTDQWPEFLTTLFNHYETAVEPYVSFCIQRSVSGFCHILPVAIHEPQLTAQLPKTSQLHPSLMKCCTASRTQREDFEKYWFQRNGGQENWRKTNMEIQSLWLMSWPSDLFHFPKPCKDSAAVQRTWPLGYLRLATQRYVHLGIGWDESRLGQATSQVPTEPPKFIKVLTVQRKNILAELCKKTLPSFLDAKNYTQKTKIGELCLSISALARPIHILSNFGAVYQGEELNPRSTVTNQFCRHKSNRVLVQWPSVEFGNESYMYTYVYCRQLFKKHIMYCIHL